jgi:hypothetical protein
MGLMGALWGRTSKNRDFGEQFWGKLGTHFMSGERQTRNGPFGDYLTTFAQTVIRFQLFIFTSYGFRRKGGGYTGPSFSDPNQQSGKNEVIL